MHIPHLPDGRTRRPVAIAAALLGIGVVLIMAGRPLPVAAHALLERSDPAEFAVLSSSPAEVRLWFAEPVIPAMADVTLTTDTGALIPVPAARRSTGDQGLVVSLTSVLVEGGYVLRWSVVSAIDGQPTVGSIPFWIGQQPGAPITQTMRTPPDLPATWPGIVVRSVALLAMLTLVGGLLATARWRKTTVRGRAATSLAATFSTTAHRLMWSAAGVLLLATVAEYLLLAQHLSGSLRSLAGLGDLFLTRPGYLLLWRTAFVGVLCLIAVFGQQVLSWRIRRSALVVGCGLLLVPAAYRTPLADQRPGRGVALTVGWLHLASGAVLFGALLLILLTTVTWRAAHTPRHQQIAISALLRTQRVPLFGALLIGTVTTLYTVWMSIGSSQTLTTTAWGLRTLTMLGLAATGGVIILLLLWNRGHRRPWAAGLLPLAVGCCAAACIGMTAAAAVPTGQEESVRGADGRIRHWSYDRTHLTLRINTLPDSNIQLDAELTADDPLSPAAQTVATVRDQDGRMQTVILEPGEEPTRSTGVLDVRSLSAPLDLEIRVTRDPQEDWIARGTIDSEAAALPTPGAPPRFLGAGAVFAVVMLAGALWLVAHAMMATSPTSERRINTAIAMALIVGSAWVLSSFRAPTTSGNGVINPQPITVTSVAAGQRSYDLYCASCHGADANGDGPAGISLSPPPADLHAAHMDDHTDGDLFWWIRNGFGTAMPGIGDRLADADTWDLVNYLRSIRHPEWVLPDLCSW